MDSLVFKFQRWLRRKTYSAKCKTTLGGQIIMIGDSIVDYYDLDKYYGDLDIKVYNRGICGETSRETLARIQQNALCSMPSKIFVLVGTNDIDRGITDVETISNLTKIISRIKKSGLDKIYIESIYPVNPNKDKDMVSVRTNEHVNSLNEQIKSLCNATGVTYINVHDSLTDEEGIFRDEYTYDGLHPTVLGYDVVTSVLMPYVIE